MKVIKIGGDVALLLVQRDRVIAVMKHGMKVVAPSIAELQLLVDFDA